MTKTVANAITAKLINACTYTAVTATLITIAGTINICITTAVNS